MPSAGLSLLGFMDQESALKHLRTQCVPVETSDSALITEWNEARAALGKPILDAGNPDLQPLPAENPHIQQLMQGQWAAEFAQLPGISFQMVEIDPVLAFQFTIETARLDYLCRGLTNPPGIGELLPLCLPLARAPEDIKISRTEHSILVRCKSLNVVTSEGGLIDGCFLGVRFGVALPFLQVVRHNNRCYMHNGFHRAVGIRSAGATHAPCLFRDVQTHADVGIRTDGGTFSADLLESGNPPTLAHFTQGRAHAVSLRSFSRVLHVSWAEYATPDE